MNNEFGKVHKDEINNNQLGLKTSSNSLPRLTVTGIFFNLICFPLVGLKRRGFYNEVQVLNAVERIKLLSTKYSDKVQPVRGV